MRKIKTGGVVTFFLAVLCLLFLAAVLLPDRGGADDNAEEELYFTILHTNDEHSALIPHSPAIDHVPDDPDPDDPTVGGFVRLANAVDQIREEKEREEEPVLLFNGGDFLGGAAFGWLAPAGYAAELTVMQEIGYDAVIIGNHEYDYGPEVLGNYLMEAGYPEAHDETVVLASNTRAPADYALAEDLYRQTHIHELENGLKVGSFGLIGKDAISVTAETGEVEFLDQHEAARDAVAELNEMEADVIVALTHSGVEEDVELAMEVPDIDIIVGGHCHTALEEPVMEGDTVIVQAGSLVRYLGRLELAYHSGTGEVRVRNEENRNDYLMEIDGTFDAGHPEITPLIEEYTAHLNDLISEKTGGRYDDVLGTIARSDFTIVNEPPLEESPAGNFITDAMRLITAEVTGKRVDVALQANGSIRESIVPGSMAHAPGEISFYDITEVMGLGYGDDGYAGYPIVSFYLTGEEVRRALEAAVLLRELMGDTYFLQFSGLQYDFDPGNAVLFTVPFLDQPVPTTMAVSSAGLYTGEGKQTEDEEDFVPLEKGDEELYHIVTDSYLLSFLPMAGEMIPWLEIIPKNEQGEAVPLERMDELIVYHNDRELKVWETVVDYAAAQPEEADGIPVIPDYYEGTSGRINEVNNFPLLVWLILILVILVVVIVLLVRRRRRRRQA